MFYLVTRKLRLLVSVSYYRSGISNSEGQALLQNGSGRRVGVRRPEDEHPGMEPPQRADPTAAAGGGGGATTGCDPPHGVAPTGAQDTTAQGRVTVELQLQEGRRPHGAEESPATMDVIVEPDGCDSQASRAASSGVLQAGGTWPRE